MSIQFISTNEYGSLEYRGTIETQLVDTYKLLSGLPATHIFESKCNFDKKYKYHNLPKYRRGLKI